MLMIIFHKVENAIKVNFNAIYYIYSIPYFRSTHRGILFSSLSRLLKAENNDWFYLLHA